MPYEGEFAAYRALQRIAETERVQQLLRRAQVYSPGASGPSIVPSAPPTTKEPLPEFIVAIDGSSQEVAVKTGYPGAQVGYLTVASVLLDLGAIDRLDAARPADPIAFRKTEEAATIDAALPGSNVVTRTHKAPRSHSEKSSTRFSTMRSWTPRIVCRSWTHTRHCLAANRPRDRRAARTKSSAATRAS